MCCVAEIICFIFGIVALVKGEFKLSRSRVVRSGPARIIGVLLLLPLLLGQGGEMIYGAVIGAKKGVELAKQGKQFKPEDAEALKGEIIGPAIVINVIGGILPLVAAIGIAIATAGPARRKKPLRDLDEDDDDDRPRRRKDREDDEAEDDDRPRRRRAVRDEDDDEAPPRRRQRDDDEEDDDREERIKKR